MKRIFLIILDSVGAGEAPDAAAFRDVGAHTLRSVAASSQLAIPNLKRLGLGNVEGLEFLGAEASPAGAYGRMQELSAGKDTTIGHWSWRGLCQSAPCPRILTDSPRM